MLGPALPPLVLCPVLPVGGMLVFDHVLAVLLAWFWISTALTSLKPQFLSCSSVTLILGSNTNSSLPLTQRACLHICRLQFLSSLTPKLPALNSKETTRLWNSLGQAR